MSISDPNVLPRTLRSIALASSISLICAGTAQAAEGEEDAAKLDKVQVTGSHIKRTDVEGPSPVVVINRDQIDQSGATTVSDLLRRLPINNGPSFDDKFQNSFAPGSSGVSLRGLGQNATLVLIDGKRVTNYGFAQNINLSFVDLNSIPLGAVERVEILKDGASALYGSDAIAGVINVIMKKDYHGQEVTVGYGQTDDSDGAETSLNLVAGRSTGRMNTTFSFDHFEREAIFLRDREYSKTADHTDQGGYGVGFDSRSSSTPVARVIRASDGQILSPPIERFNYNQYISAVPETRRDGALLNFNYEITRALEAFSQVSYSKNHTTTYSAPTPLFGDLEPGKFIVSSTQAYNTYGEDVHLRWRMVEAGPRINDIETDAARFVGGFKGTVSDWDWDTSYLYSRSKTLNTGTNYISTSALSNAINTDQINPFGTTYNNPNAINAVKATTRRIGLSTLWSVDAKASTEIVQMPAGPLSVAFGVEHRYESIEDSPDDRIRAGDIVGSGGTSSSGNRDINAGFIEFGIPVVESLELQLALRAENYSDFGSTTNPKLALKYQPVRSLMLRASYATGFRAPSLPELYLGDTLSYPFIFDAERCDAATAAGPTFEDQYCNFTQPPAHFAGNTDLDPEESKSFNIGGVWEPVNKLSIGLDFWRYEHTDRIDSYDEQYMLDNPTLFPGLITRGTPQFTGDPGEVLRIDNSFINLSEQETQGVDLDIQYIIGMGPVGTLTLRETATFTDEFKRRPFPSEDFDELAGTYQYPKLRSLTDVVWQLSAHTLTFSADLIGPYDDFYSNEYTDETVRVDKYLTYNLQYAADTSVGKFTFGVDNLLDEDPPFTNAESEGYDYATHDPRGRYIYGRYNIKF